MADDNPEYGFVFNPDYNSHQRFTFNSQVDSYPVSTPSTSNINISRQVPGYFDDTNHLTAYRFDGTKWNLHKDGTGNISAWDRLTNSAPDVLGFSKGVGYVVLASYNANTEIWNENIFKTSENWLDRYVKVSSRSALLGDQLYFLEPDGQLKNIGQIDIDDLRGDSWFYDVKSINNLYAVSKPFNKTRFYRVFNGEVEVREIRKNMDKRTRYYDVGDRLLGDGIMAAFDSDERDKYNARSFSLYKWSDNNFRSGHKAIIVHSVMVNDGDLDIYKSYSYNTMTAKMDKDGVIPYFNLVSVVSGSQDPSVQPKGKTKHYFYNGRALADLPNVPADQTDDDALLFAGNLYRTDMFNANEELISRRETVYSSFKQSMYNTSGEKIDQTYYVRPTISVTSEFLPGGTQSVSTTTTYNTHGYPIWTRNYSHQSAGTAKASSAVQYIYYPQAYDETAYNIYSEIIGTVSFTDGEVVSSSAVVWDVVGPDGADQKPQAIKRYSWNGFGSSAFTAWDGSPPDAQWRLSSEILIRDDKGNILESTDFLQEKQSAIYDQLKRSPILSATYAGFDNIAGTSFEEGQAGQMSYFITSDQEAYTGQRSLHNSSTTSPSLPLGEYHVYYWYKSAPGTVSVTSGTAEDLGDKFNAKGWTLRKWKVSGSGVITLTTTGYLDELRIHPAQAYVTTYVYNDRQLKTAETGPDLMTTFYTYDDYYRQLYIADKQGNIVLKYEYGFKENEE